MMIERALTIKRDVVRSIRDAMATAKLCKMTAQEETDHVLKAMRFPKGTPEWVRQYCQGYWTALRDARYERGELVYGGYIGVAFYSTHRSRPDYYENNGIAPSAFAMSGDVKALGHYWAHDLTRPYFVSETGARADQESSK